MYNRETVKDMLEYNNAMRYAGTDYSKGDLAKNKGIVVDTENLLERFLRGSERLEKGPNGKNRGAAAKTEYQASLGFLKAYHMAPNSGGGKNDCLVISFLMGVSPTYRKLTYKDKYDIASRFRRDYVPLLLNGLEETIQRFRSTEFLVDSDMSLLSRLFNVNILSLESYKDGMGPTAIIVGLSDKSKNSFDGKGIIIINRSNSHYETVAKTEPLQYMFSMEELNAFYREVMNNNPYKRTDTVVVGFKPGATVIYKYNKKPYTILEKLYIPESGGKVIDQYQLEGINGKKIWVNPNSLSALPKNAPVGDRAKANAKEGGRRTKRRKTKGRKTKRKTRR